MCDSNFFRNRVTVPGANIQTVCGVEIWCCLLFVEWLFVGCETTAGRRDFRAMSGTTFASESILLQDM